MAELDPKPGVVGVSQRSPIVSRSAVDPDALASLVQGANAFADMQRLAAIQAQQLPNPRLDHPVGDTLFVRDDGGGSFSVFKPSGEVVTSGLDFDEAVELALD